MLLMVLISQSFLAVLKFGLIIKCHIIKLKIEFKAIKLKMEYKTIKLKIETHLNLVCWYSIVLMLLKI